MGTGVDEVCRKIGVSQATFFRWKQKYGGLGPSELRKLRQLEEEFKENAVLAEGEGLETNSLFASVRHPSIKSTAAPIY